jgi:hypothetical protein
MRTKILYLALFTCLGLYFTSCKKDKNEPATQPETTAYTPGQTIAKSFSVGSDTVVKMTDVATNYGTATNRAIFLVHQNTSILKAGYENVFFPVYKDELESFMQAWAKEFNLNINGTADEKANAYKHLLFYLVENKIDAGLLVGAVTQKLKSLSSVVKMVDDADKVRLHSKVNIMPTNDLLFNVVQENKTPEVIFNKYVTTKLLKETDVGAVISVLKNIREAADVILDFVKDNKATTDAPDNMMSFINSSDTIVANYKGGTGFQSPVYSLSYDVGLWKAKLSYHITGTYGATSPNVAGHYITACNTQQTSISCNGPLFSVNSNVTYSPAINAGSIAVPAADMNGKVSADYGDCCCFHYYSYLNFTINANTGYQEVSFSKGK